MPNTRMRRNSVVDMISKVHVNRGSLLKSIENLLKTIESSESAVMIPTLLRDKCEFDAWELLFVAKILKASILGHSDLVEFYMNHMGNAAAANGTAKDVSSPIESPGGIARVPTSPSLSSNSSISSAATTTTNGHSQHQNGSRSQQSSAASWMTANQTSSANISSGSFSNSSSESTQSSAASTNSSSGSSSNGNLPTGSNQVPGETRNGSQASFRHRESNGLTVSANPSDLQDPIQAPRPLLRQAQPPSLLQLTTTNNHINSVVNGFSANSFEQMTSQLTAIQLNNNNNTITNGAAQVASSTLNDGTSPNGALSISTTVANQQSPNAPASANGCTSTSGKTHEGSNGNGSSNSSQQNNGSNPHHPAELRTSRSAGCLFRVNSSGASSPRTPAQTPTTPYPQAETLANGQSASLLLASDPGAPAKLLVQIEQLKTSINHVTTLLESVVELYKKSIDNIA